VFLILAIASLNFSLADKNFDKKTLKCMVKYLQERGINEKFIGPVDMQVRQCSDCEIQMSGKLKKAYNKISEKIRANYSLRQEPCIMEAVKSDDNIKLLIIRREAIKLSGVGVQLWKYAQHKKHLDELKEQRDSLIRTATDKCLSSFLIERS